MWLKKNEGLADIYHSHFEQISYMEYIFLDLYTIP